MQNHRTIPLIITITAMCAPFIAFATNVHAGNRNWLGNSGKWGQQNNWNPAFVPVVGDHAVFSTPTGYTVDLTGSVIVDVLDFTSGAGTFTSIGGGPWTLRMIAGTGLNLDAGLIIGQNIIFNCDQTASIEAEFKLLGNATLNCDNLNIGTTTTNGIFEAAPGIVDVDIAAQIGNFDGSYGRFYLDGGATQYTSAFTHLINGEMTISGGAKANMTIFTMNAGNPTANHSLATFTGSGTEVTVTGLDFPIGNTNGLGSATLRLQTGATLNANGIEVFHNGSLEHTGGTLDAGPGITVDGGTWTRAAGTSFSLDNTGFDVQLRNEAVMDWEVSNDFGTPSNQPWGNYEINEGSLAEVHGAWRIGNAPGTRGVTFMDTDSEVSLLRTTLRSSVGGAGADLYVGNFGVGYLYVNDGALCDFGDDFIIAAESGSYGYASINEVGDGVRSTVDIVSGGSDADFIVGRLGNGECIIYDGGLVDVGGDAMIGSSAGGIGLLTIEGDDQGFDSELAVDGVFAIGGSATAQGGNGSVHITEGGKATASQVIVWPSGVLVVNLTSNVNTNSFTCRGDTTINTGGRISASNCYIQDAGPDNALRAGGAQGANGPVQSTINVSNGLYIGGDGVAASGIGTLELRPWGVARANNAYVWPGGTLILMSEALAAPGVVGLRTSAGIQNHGTIEGDGTIGKETFASVSFQNYGDIHVGRSNNIGMFRVSDIHLTCNPAGTVHIELAGLGDGEYDTMVFVGNALITLGGSLHVDLLNGFTPALDDEFTIIPAAGINSSDLTSNFSTITNPEGYEFELQVFTEHAVLKVIDVPCPANIAGNDDVIDVTDLFALLANWNTSGAGADLAPPTNIVDVSDLFVLLGAWGVCP